MAAYRIPEVQHPFHEKAGFIKRRYLYDIFEIIKHLYFPIAIIIIEIIAFIILAQGKDLMRDLPTLKGLKPILILFLFIWSSVIIWRGSRIILIFSTVKYINLRFSAIAQYVIPRILSGTFMSVFVIGILLAKGDKSIRASTLYAITSILLILFFIFRRTLLKFILKDKFKEIYVRPGALRLENFRDFYINYKFFTYSTIVLIISLIVVLISKVSAPTFISPLGIILLAFVCWSGIGIIIKIFDKHTLFPVLNTLILSSIIFSFWNFNHIIKSSNSQYIDKKISLETYFAKWVKDRNIPDNTKYPLFIVTAEGGASRSAYWTSGVLSQIQQKDSTFIHHIFAISSVSGGTLGSTTFSFIANENYSNIKQSDIVNISDSVLKEDFLSPVSAGLLFSDMLQHILPIRFPFLSRANYLEKSWETAWNKHLKKPSKNISFKDLAYDPNSKYPLLFMNTTQVESGNRTILSIPFLDSNFTHAEQILYERNLNLNFSISKAVSTSAAFPYISPSLRIYNSDKNSWGHLVDGGYYENSGILTAVDIYNQLCKYQDFNKVDIYFIIIRAFPNKEEYKAKTGMNEILDPGRTLLNSRGQRTPDGYKLLVNTLSNMSDKPDTLIFNFQLCAKSKDIPVSWYLSEEAINEMNSLLIQEKNIKIYNRIIDLIKRK